MQWNLNTHIHMQVFKQVPTSFSRLFQSWLVWTVSVVILLWFSTNTPAYPSFDNDLCYFVYMFKCTRRDRSLTVSGTSVIQSVKWGCVGWLRPRWTKGPRARMSVWTPSPQSVAGRSLSLGLTRRTDGSEKRKPPTNIIHISPSPQMDAHPPPSCRCHSLGVALT